MFRHASRNRAYSLVWNEEHCAYVPAPENSRARRKRSGGVAVAAVLAAGNAFAIDPGAHPTGGAVVGGQATISQAGAVTTIAQGTQRAVINWQTFDIGSRAVVNFVQPNSGSVALNQVLTQNPTQIAGALNANGQVFVVNPSGVLFAPGAQVSAAGILASTRTVSTDDFMAGRLVFSGNSNGSVVNRGSISAAQGGYVVLVGAQVVNEGSINAPGGDVRMAAADQVTLKVDGTGLAMFQVDRGTLDGLVANHGVIRADGGRIYLTADALDALSKATVNNTGLIEALSIDNRHGVVELLGDARVGRVEVGGLIDVSSATGSGGQVAVTAHDVALKDGSSIDASGALGGGKTLVGGGWQGQDATIANASTVTMAPTARIDVGARDTGDGGTAVLWSQDQTSFAGAIMARGGAAAGKGGQVETSSHDNLQAFGSVDAAAPAGAAGLWLLDPRNVIIAASGASGTPFAGSGSYGQTATYTPAADSTILASTIVNTLNAGANVTVTTGSTGASAGNITVNAPIAMASLYGFTTSTLTLLAANDINVNAQISTGPSAYYDKLNVVLTPGSNGNVNLSSAGRIATAGGNVYVGTVSGSGQSEAVARSGQNFTMAAGSTIDVVGGMLDVQVNGAVTIPASSLLNAAGSASYNNGAPSLIGSLVRLHGASITSSNVSATTPDIVTTANTTLQADTVGSSANPIKISAGASQGYAKLDVSNSVGNSYVNEIVRQAYSTVAVSVGSQEGSVQDIRILGDFGGDGHSGVGHILLNNDNSGVLNIAAGDIRTAGGAVNQTQKTNVEVNATTMTFADGSVDTGAAYFSASGTGLRGVAAANNVADIAAPDVRLSGVSVGTQANPVELSSGTTTAAGVLTVTNSGGSTFLKSVDDNFTTINLNHVKDSGTHSILFAGGDHLDYATDGSNVVLPTIGGGASDGSTFFATTGMDGSRRNRAVVITPLTGGALFGDNSIDLAAGALAVIIPRANATGTIAAANVYNAEAPAAQITAGNVTFSAQNDLTPSVTTIGAGGKDIQIAQGVGAANNTLSVATQQGSVAIHELTQNHFKTVSLSLGSASAAQSVAIDLAGPDDINFSDSGSLVTVDATKVAVSGNNRNFSLSAGSRSIQTNGNSLGTGYYTLNAGNLLKLNSDIRTDGGDINLFGFNGVDLLQPVLVDSNVGRLGAGGDISIGASTASPTATVSSTGGSRTLTVDSSSTDGTGGDIGFASNVDNRAGAFLTGLSLKSSGTTYARDGSIGLGTSGFGAAGSIRLKGDFSSTGKSSLNDAYGFTIDTEQGNSTAGGNITFAGADLLGYLYYGLANFNASTGLANANGGNVSLATQSLSNTAPTLGSVIVDARGGSGGVAGDVTLPALTTTSLYGGVGTQAYFGRNITLNGNLSSSEQAIGLNGNVRLARSVTIATNSSNAGSTGAVTIAGAGVSATAPGAGLTINTSTTSGNRGAVSIAGGATASGGYYLDSLSIRTNGSGGSNGAIALGNVATEGTQTYAGGTVSVGGGMSTNGGDIDLRNAAGLTITGSAGSAFAIDTDRAGGSNAAGALRLGSTALNGNYALTIDTTADGGGSNADLVLNGVGAGAVFASINVAAGNVTLAGSTRASNITVEARGAAADLTIASTGALLATTLTPIVLAAGRNFTNNRGASAIDQSEGGRYLIYSTDPAASLEGMTGYSKHYNQGYVAGATPSYAGSGNWFFYRVAPVISVTTNGTSIVYGNPDPSSTLTAANYSGFIDGDTRASLSGTQTLTLAAAGVRSGSNNRQVGTYAYTLNGTLTDSLGYQYAPFLGDLAVTPRALAISGIAASSKAYDGNTSAALTGTANINQIVDDSVALVGSGASGSFADKNAASGKSVAVTGYTLTGADAGNYSLQPTSLVADITPKALAIAGSSVTTKTYDRSTAAEVAAGTLSGLVGSETLNVGASGNFADKNVGNGKTVNATYVLGDGDLGGLAANYSLAGQALTGSIVAKAITVAATGVDKVYDGTRAATATLASTGVVAGDDVGFGGTASFADKNAGAGKVVGVSGIASSGEDAGNYSLNNTSAATTASIAAKAITVAATGVDKVYDGTRAATATLASAGVVAGDDVGFGGTASFADKNAGAGKVVGVSGIASSGEDAGNYSLNNTSAATTASIAAKAITVAATGVDKVYDGTRAATATLASAGVVEGDSVGFGGTASFADKNAGAGKVVGVSGIASSGEDAGNYSLVNTSATTTASIATRAITVAATGVDKVYDGTRVASATFASAGVVEGDSVGFGGTASFADKNAGVGKAVSVSGIGSSGDDAANYSLNNTSASTTASIAAKAITVAATGVDKVYDGTRTATATLASAGVVAGDDVGFGGTASFVDRSAGVGKVVNVGGIGSSGEDAGNYSLSNTTAATTATIAAKAITVAATGVDKVYDGSTAATATLASAGVVEGDDVGFGGTASFADKNAGVGKVVSVSGIGSRGEDAGNYSLDNTSAATTANIATKAITVAAVGVDKVYDGTRTASATFTGAGVVEGDSVGFGGIASFADKNAGAGKVVSVSGIASSGDDAGNYSLSNTTAATTASIAAKAITVAAVGVDKVYDGSTAATATYASAGVVEGDSIGFGGTASFADKNAGVGKAVSVSGIGSSGEDAGNYSLSNTTAATSASIAARAITVAAVGVDKVYDGSTAATAALSSNGVLEGDAVSFTGTATLADKNVGIGKAIGVTGIAASGTDSGNYSVNGIAGTTADVTAKAITVAASGVDKIYDGSTAATVVLASNGVVSGDTIDFGGAASFANKNVGTSKEVSVSGIGSSGADAGNYSLSNTTAATSASIAAKAISVAATGVDKVYDGTTAATATLASAGVVSGDLVSFDGIATLADKNVGIGKAVGVTGIAASGTDAGNYIVDGSAATTANVTARAITVAATGVDKVYDGTTAATATLASAGVISGDQVRFGGTATLVDKNVGTGKAVGVTGIAASGTDAGNYSFNAIAGTTADVTAKAIVVAATGVDKVYDGSTAATVTLASAGVVSGDSIGFGGIAKLADKNVGVGKGVDVTGIAASGIDAGNYSINGTAGTTANVTAKAITVAATGIDKVYDGTTAATSTLASNGIVAGDAVTFGGVSTLADKNAGIGKTIGVTGIAASGTDAGNYSFNSIAGTTADVTAKAITVAAIGVDKVYDGTVAAMAVLASNGVVAGDTVDFSSTASFGDKNAGLRKTIDVAGISARGSDAGNYAVSNTTAAAAADITPKGISVGAVGVDKVYDGSTAATATLASAGVVSGDTVAFGGNASFADKNAGLGKTIGVTGIAASGADANNYALRTTTAAAAADIAPKPITVAARIVDKVYDGSTATSATLTSNGLVPGDVVSFAGSASFVNRDAGTGKAVSVTSIAASGADAANYSFSAALAATADVAPKLLELALVGQAQKSSDGSTNVKLAADNYLISGVVSGDSLSITKASGVYADVAPGAAPRVAVNLAATDYLAGSGTLLSNYSLVTGEVVGNVGLIAGSPSSQGSGLPLSALVSLPNLPNGVKLSGLPSTDGTALINGEDQWVDAAEAIGTTPPDATTQRILETSTDVTTNTREKLLSRRTFTIGDGGMRLPAGVKGSEKDGSQ